MDAVERGAVRIGVERAHVSGRLLAGVAAALAMVILVGVVAATSLVGGRAVVGERIVDRSYDQVEALRTSRGLTAGTGAWSDDSYDRIESMRGGVTIAGDRSYDEIERLRGSATSK
jgi:hypothetical protein